MIKAFKRLVSQHLRMKLILVYLLVGMLPYTVFLLHSYQNIRDLTIKNETVALHNSLDQALNSVNATLGTYSAMCNYVFNDRSLLSVLNRDYGDKYYDMYDAYAKSISPSFTTYYALYPGLERISIYTACDIHPYEDYTRPLEQLSQDEPWFAAHPISFVFQWVAPELSANGMLVCARRVGVTNVFPYENVLYLAIDPGTVFRPIYSISAQPYAVLVRHDGESFFLCNTLSEGEAPDAQAILQNNPSGFNVIEGKLPATGWSLYFISDFSALLSAVNHSIIPTYIGAWLLILLLGVVVIGFISSLTRPIESLAANLRVFGHGDMTVAVPTRRVDEIGQLERSFNDMAKHIRELIEVTYNNEIRERELQQRLLQAQINPHFLYNSLSIINCKAIMAEQPEISAMAMQLSCFYRSALNHGRQITTISNELTNIHTYVELQLALCSNYFTPVYDVDDALLDVRIPNFILQPIVENAIDHGLRNSLRTDKILSIRVFRQNGDAVFVIHDNGAGMDEATRNALFNEKSDGYGIRNVDDRLRLIYGERYAFSIESQLHVSTTVTLRLPIDALCDSNDS